MRAIIDIDWVVRLLLVSLRLSVLLLATPLFALSRIPQHVKVLAILIFSAAIAITAVPASGLALSTGTVLLAGIGELIVGAMMAFGLHCAFAAFQFGGRLLDLQMGFGIANLINPSSEEQDPLLGTVALLAGVMTFYLLDGHLWVVRAFVQSYDWFPIGKLPDGGVIDAIVAQFGLMFSLGTVLVAPVVTVLLLVDVGLAMAAKTMPQLNVFMLSIPIKIAIGLLVFAASAPYVGWAIERILESIFAYWQALAQ